MDFGQKTKELIIRDPIIEKIINELNLNEKQIESGIEIFAKIVEENKNIANYEFITEVQIYDENNIVGISVPNKKLINSIKRKKLYWLSNISNASGLIHFANPRSTDNHKIKENIFYWKLPNLEDKNNRSKLATWLKEYYSNSRNNKYSKGMYLYGKFGLGKTYFLQALTNYVIDKDKSVIYVNISDLYEYMTNNMERNNELNSDAVYKMKNVDILIIDDIGSEKQSNWFLFSIIYQILDLRLREEKTTCFSSIFSISELKKYWLKNKELDSIKVERLIDKIKSLTTQIELKGINIRDL